MFNLKKMTALFLTLTMAAGVPSTALANEVPALSTQVYSPEFPNAYLITETVPSLSTYSGNTTDGTYLIDSVSVTAFVEESYAIDDYGQLYVAESRLLSEDEVNAIGIENFADLDSAITPYAATNSYGKLTMSFAGNYTVSGNSVTCDLDGNAQWDYGPFTSTELNPAAGDDYIGVTWSGSFTTSSSSCSATDVVGSSVSTRMVDSIANGGRVWAFKESLFEDHFANHCKNINVDMTIKKNNKTGNGNTAEAILKYIHTYEATTGSISMNAGSDSVSAGFTLSNVAKQWSLVCTITGIPY